MQNSEDKFPKQFLKSENNIDFQNSRNIFKLEEYYCCKNCSKSLRILLIITILSTFSFALLVPILYSIIRRMGGSIFLFGIIGASYGLFQLIGVSFLGNRSDKHGRKPILIISIFGSLISWIIIFIAFFLPNRILIDFKFSFSGTLIISLQLLVILFSRIVAGITEGRTSASYAYLSDISTLQNKMRNFNYLTISSNSGLVLGSATTFILIKFYNNPILLVMLAIIISLLNLILLLIYLEPLRVRYVHQRNVISSKKSISSLIKNYHILELISVNFLIYLGFNIFYISLTAFMTNKDVSEPILFLSLYYGMLNLLSIIVQTLVIKYVINKFSRELLIIIGGIFLSIGFGLLMLGDILFLIFSILLIAIGNGLMYPSFLSLVSKHGDNEYQGSIQGLSESMGVLASILGLLLGGILYNILDRLTFIIASFVILIATIISIHLFKVEGKHHLLKPMFRNI